MNPCSSTPQRPISPNYVYVPTAGAPVSPKAVLPTTTPEVVAPTSTIFLERRPPVNALPNSPYDAAVASPKFRSDAPSSDGRFRLLDYDTLLKNLIKIDTDNEYAFSDTLYPSILKVAGSELTPFRIAEHLKSVIFRYTNDMSPDKKNNIAQFAEVFLDAIIPNNPAILDTTKIYLRDMNDQGSFWP